MPTSQNIETTLLDAVKQTDGYVTVPYLTQVTGSAPEVVEQFVTNHPHEIRKSLLKTDDGQPLLMFNSPWSGVRDIWAAFRYINYKKY